MASVKERAAALNLAGKLYSPMHNPHAQQALINPCQTSFIWSRLISHLQSEVKVKRRRHFLKSHDNCFVGSDAVTVIQDYIKKSKLLGDAEVPRGKAVRVCQALLDCKVFEAVAGKTFGKESKLSEFQDSVSSLYRFLNTQTPVLSSAGNDLSSPSEVRNANSTPVKPGYIMDILLEELDLSLSVLHAESLPPSVVSKVWQEQTVQRLLQLIELPVLDGVLDCRDCPTSGGNNNEPDILYTSNYLDREIIKAFKESQNDEWLLAALELMDFLPDQQVVEVSRELSSISMDDDQGDEEHEQWRLSGIQQYKALLFEILAKHYGQTSFQPLLPNGLNDVYTHITELLVNGKFDVALEVLQLCLKLLPAANREELYRLLSFMSLAADPLHIRLHKEIENRIHVKKTFCRAITQSKSLSKGKVDLLLLFMLDNHEDIFKVPGSLHKLVSDKLDDIVKKKDPNTQSSAFCQQISSNVYQDTVKNLTHTELFVLLRNIDENTKYSTKEKKRLLAQFYKGHPDIFAEYFGSRLSTINLSEV
ncbi:DEP domain-containing protein 7 isoform 2-T2 [Clarias gariepinus]|uniref:DEP domain-containing protein 7 isoform X2 n=1 Tax=Clarias gariepinus TaxID=13013 RepID=UPI00234C389E|nr:DEP domain-containing protein 7 isoform X2 [Clarias gariepinus]